MGTNKAFLTVHGRRIIDSTVHLFNTLFRQVILVTNNPLDYTSLDLEIAGDLMQKPSPLMGIYTGLFYSRLPHSFAAGCDMPLIRRPVVEYMISLCPGQDVIIHLLDDGYHPLHAIYAKHLIKPMQALLHAGKFKITDFFPGCGYVRLLPASSCPSIPHSAHASTLIPRRISIDWPSCPDPARWC